MTEAPPREAAARAIARYPTRNERMASVGRDLRTLAVGVTAAMTTFDPGFTLRTGAYLIVLLALPNAVRYRPKTADVLALGFAVLSLFSMWWSVAPQLTSPVWKDQLAVGMIFVAVRIIAKDRRTLIGVARGYLAGCIYSCVLLIRASTTGVTLTFNQNAERVGISGLNYNYTAYALATGLAVLPLLAVNRRRHGPAPALIAVALLLWVGILQTGTRGGVVAAVAVVAWWALLGWKALSLRVLKVITAVLALSFLTGYADPILAANVQADTGRETGTLNGRLTLWPAARHVFSDHFWNGAGAGTFPTYNPDGVFAHDALLDIASGLGIVGLLTFVYFIAAAFRETRDRDPRARSLLMGALTCASVPPLLSGYWHQSPAAWLVLALFTRMAVLVPEGPAVTARQRSRAPRPSRRYRRRARDQRSGR